MTPNRPQRRWLLLKPFDESQELAQISRVYDQGGVLAAAIIASALASCAGLVLAAVGSSWGLAVIGVAISASAVTAGLEWNAGLKARALNQLFSACLSAGLYAFISWVR